MTPRHNLLLAVIAAIGAGGSLLHAQEGGDDAAPADALVPMEKQAQLTPAEMREGVKKMRESATLSLQKVEALKAEALKQKDVIKLNCINDKLVQLKELLEIAETSSIELEAAIAEGDDAERYHRYSIITISGEKIDGLEDEAQACVGEEIDYLGPLDIDVDAPGIPDDPTVDDPFDGDTIEPPGYASPFA